MIGQKNIGVKHFFNREIEVQVRENLNLDYVSMAAKGLGCKNNLPVVTGSYCDCSHNGAEFVLPAVSAGFSMASLS